MAARSDLDGLLPQLHRILSDESQGNQEKLVSLRKKCEGMICEERIESWEVQTTIYLFVRVNSRVFSFQTAKGQSLAIAVQ